MSLDTILNRLAGQPVIPRRKKRLRPARFIVETLENRVLLTTYTVNTTNPGFGGPGEMTLPEAIGLVNADTGNPGRDTINFKITLNVTGGPVNPGVQTISLITILPAITHQGGAIIDGTTQLGYSPGHPMVDIDGSQAAANNGSNGLVFQVGGNIVQGLIISHFQGTGIVLDGTNDPAHNQGPNINNTIQGNYIGTDPTGQNAAPNTIGGIQIINSSYNLIGGLNTQVQLINGNLISGNGQNGVFLASKTDSHNYIEGNYIGTDITGLKPIAGAQSRVYGVALVPPLNDPNDGYASNNYIGDFDPNELAFDPNGRNIISGNTADGVLVVGGSGNQIAGNYIGLGVDGKTPVANGEDGVVLQDATLNTVGGTTAGSGNVISGNLRNGISIVSATATEYGLAIPVSQQSTTNNVIQGNYIGTDASGTTFVPNGDSSATGKNNYGEGILLKNQATDPSVVVSFNMIGGENPSPGTLGGGGNLISGNWDDGILIAGANVTENSVDGNYIGTDITGHHPLINSNFGVELNSIAGQTGAPSGNFIGSPETGGGNLISSNGTSAQGNTPAIGGGVGIANGANANLVQNNFIGTDASGLKFLPNAGDGISISSANGNTIGGRADGDDNVISGNDGNGITIVDATGNKVQKNLIGVGDDDSTRLPNLEGIALIAATGNTIGGIQTVGNQDSSLGNVISANSTTGIAFSAQANSNQVVGNMIGTDQAGQLDLGNGDFGILINDSSSNTIGGTTTVARNLIVFSGSDGIDIESVANNGQLPPNVIEGDYIGVGGPNGTQPEGNTDNGILINNSSSNMIGGPLVNVISDNGLDGVQITGQQSQSNAVAGNYIGITADGSSALPNGVDTTEPLIDLFGSGVVITNGALSNTIGGTASGSNVISGNQVDGVFIYDAGIKNSVTNNYIGTNAKGNAAPTGATTQLTGVSIDNTAQTTIGGASFAQGGNVISGNQDDGIFVNGPGSTPTTITGNYIGTDNAAATPIGNDRNGIDLVSLSTPAAAGGSGPSSNATIGNNTIAGNLQGGIALISGTTNVHITNNYIGTNSNFIPSLPNYGYGIKVTDSPGNYIGAQDSPNQIYFTAVTNKIPVVNGFGVLIVGQASTGNDVADNVVSSNAMAGIEIAGGASGNKIGNTQGNTINGNFNGVVITDGGTQNNTVENNYVGINTDDSVAGNTHDGILVTAGASYNIIGDVSADGYSNVVSANAFDGVEISGQGTSYNTVINNLIGTNVEGKYEKGQPFGNGSNGSGVGVEISAPYNRIGGNTDYSGNVIVGSFQGIALDGASATGDVILGNDINDNGANGILITDGASGNNIGGPDNDDGNKIHDNASNGVAVVSGTADSIRHNLIYANGKLGIALSAQANANNSLPAPLLAVATQTRLAGWLQAAPDTTYAIEFFEGQQIAQADGISEDDDARSIVVPFLPPSSPDEAPEPFEELTTNAKGVAFFDLSFGVSPSVATDIRATVTDPNGNTSQFSNPAIVQEDSTGVGIPDDDQNGNSGTSSDVTFRDALNSSQFINLATETPGVGAFQNVWSVPDPDPNDTSGPPSNTQFGLGFVSFTLTGVPAPTQDNPTGEFSVVLTLPVTASSPTSYWRYGPTPNNPEDHWYNWIWDGTESGTGAEIKGDTIILHFIDGALGDDDGTVNGTIVDAGGPGFADPYTVTTTADSGPGSLRQAILNADANPGSDITFDIPGSAPQTSQLLSPLPAITANVTIDGSTQPGYTGTPLVVLDGSQAGAGADGLTVAAGFATIQDLVINQFSGDGIHVLSAGAAQINGNYIGTDASGKTAEGNSRYGVEIDSQSSDPVDPDNDGDNDNAADSGDTDDDAVFGGPSTINGGNVISANTAGGIYVHGINAYATMTNNFIGTQADGVSPLGNGGPGVVLDAGSTGNTIGGQTSATANTIAFNSGDGVEILQSTENQIEANSIFANQGLGIDLNSADNANDSQVAPVLAGAASYGGQTFISGTLNTSPDSGDTIDFYANDKADPSGFGQGQIWLGSIQIDTDDNGQASFDADLPASAAVGTFITATASYRGFETSEFSNDLALTPTSPLVLIVNTTADSSDAVPGCMDFSLRDAILASNAHPGQNIIDFDLPNADRVIWPQSPLPTITNPAIIDGTSQPGYQGLPLVELNGSLAGKGAAGLTISGGGSIVRGLDIHGFANDVVLTGQGGNQIQGCFLGTDVTGTSSGAPDIAGVEVQNSPDNLIGGTTAADRNVATGIVLDGSGSTGNVVEGNYIDTDLNGTAALLNADSPLNFFSNGPEGVLIVGGASANTVGGATAGAQNVIEAGLLIINSNSNIVQGNLVGTDVTGTVFLSANTTIAFGQGPGVVETGGSGNLIGGTIAAARNVIPGGVGLHNGAFNDTVQGNYIGTDITGTVALGGDGVFVDGTSNTIGGAQPGAGNLISGLDDTGISLLPTAYGNIIQGNRIGTDVTGTKALGNTGFGIDDQGQATTIGGNLPGEGNLISANGSGGIVLRGGKNGGDTVQGNLIGTDQTGTTAFGNGSGDGIDVEESGAIIGGSQPGDGNVISGSLGSGIALENDFLLTGLSIQGNHIGTDVTGTLPLGNGGDGISILNINTPNAVIGGAAPGAGNVISANGGDGIDISDNPSFALGGDISSGAVIQGNKIGTDVTGTRDLGNAGDGISIITSNLLASDETIGGTSLGAGNTIAFNDGRGVNIPFGNGNSVRGNDIFDNGGLGLITDINSAAATYAEDRGVTPSQPVPVLTSAVLDPQGTIVTGSLTSTPFTRYEIDFFANDAVNTTGFGDGQTYLQSISALVDDTGSAQFQIPLDEAVPIGQWITATATPDTTGGNTSMFSQPTAVVGATGNTLQFSSPNYLVTETGGSATVVVTRSGDTSGTANVDYATGGGTATAGVNYTAQSGTLTFAAGVTSQTIAVPIQDDGLPDGDKDFQIRLSNPSGATLGAAIAADVTIADSNSAGEIQFSSPTSYVDKAVALEAEDTKAGAPPSVFTVTRTGGSQGTVSVEYRVTGGTAISAGYVEDGFGTVTFAPGQTTAQIMFGYEQSPFRGPQTLQVTIGNPTGGAVLGATTTSVLTIDDPEDQNGAFQVQSVSAQEVPQSQFLENAGQAFIEVQRVGQSSATEEVSYSTADGTATAGTNYVATSGTLTFQPGQTEAFFAVPLLDDHLNDNPGSFQVVLSDPTGGAFILDGLGQCVVTILDSDAPLPPATLVAETVNNQGSTVGFPENSGTAIITVARSGNTSGVVTVDYATSDGTAHAGSDYTAESGRLTFNAGQAFASFSVPLRPGQDFPNTRTFFVTLSNVVGDAVISSDSPVTETIFGAAGQIQMATSSYSVAQNISDLTVTVTRLPVNDLSGYYATVNYATHGGTATALSPGDSNLSLADYIPVSGTLTFAAGVTSQTITIPILNNLQIQNDKTFYLTLSNPTGGPSIGTISTAEITILSSDVPDQTCTMLTSDHPAGSTYGQTVTLTATVVAPDGTPTGSVDFFDTTTGQDLGTAPLSLVGGVDQASLPVTSLPAGSDSIVATYMPDTGAFLTSQGWFTQLVVPATLTVAADNQRMVFGGTVPALNYTITGFVNGDMSSAVSGAASLSTTATSSSDVGNYSITIGSGTLSAANYTFVFVDGTLTVVPTTLTLDVAANDLTKVYGSPNPPLTYTITGFANGDTASVLSGAPSLSTTATTASGVGTYPIDVSAGTLSAANYTFAFVDGTLTITPATLFVTADNKTMVYGATVPALTDTITGFVNGDTSSVVSGKASLSTTATSRSEVGNYAITVGLGTLTAANYTFAVATLPRV
jgi:hypothetical protein